MTHATTDATHPRTTHRAAHGTTHPAFAIEADGLRRGYTGGFEAVRGISFTVPR